MSVALSVPGCILLASVVYASRGEPMTDNIHIEIGPESPEVAVTIETCYGRVVTLFGWWDSLDGGNCEAFNCPIPHNSKILSVESCLD